MGVLASIFLHLRRQRPRGGRGGESRTGGGFTREIHAYCNVVPWLSILVQVLVTIDMTFELKLHDVT